VTTLHVSPAGSDLASGTEDTPLRTINRAAQLAMPGDTVLVHEGTYREWVDPRRGGRGEGSRITYQAVPGEHVTITGTEPLAEWEPVAEAEGGAAEGGGGATGVFTATVPNTLFGDWNPFAIPLTGDWVVRPLENPVHLGDVYLNGRSLYEAGSLEEVSSPIGRETAIDDWTQTEVMVPDREWTTRVWFAEVGEETTRITANFGGADPREENVEISVRRSVFWPRRHHRDFITVRGFELWGAATPWAPPTADQPGLIGPNWSKGWIIEDNDVHDSKCSGISLGKESSTGDNFATERGDKPGYQYQLESVFSAVRIGWSKELIGSHVVRDNHIHDCGQTGIVGHLGPVFSDITGNHIHHIGIKREFFGHEIGGIKLHAAIDTTIADNTIHDCSLGIWLDWEVQGTRVSRNLLHRNSRDLFIEVSHGPYIVDHNLLLSPASLENHAQGGAYLFNVVAGTLSVQPQEDRATPYHLPHSTEVAGYARCQTGDDRYVGNVFLGGTVEDAYGKGWFGDRDGVASGTSCFDAYPESFEAYMENVGPDNGHDHGRFNGKNQPVYIHDNVYANGATAYAKEERASVLSGDVGWELVEAADGGVGTGSAELRLEPAGALAGVEFPTVSGADLGSVRFAAAEFEERDGSPAVVAEARFGG
jgi:hypothetical protein